MKTRIATNQAPQAVGPYSQAVSAGDFVFVSGQIPLDPESGKLVEGGLERQTGRIFQNIGAILKEAGLDFSHVVSATVFLTNINDFNTVNDVYGKYFEGGVLPARSAVQVAALPKGAKLEISCTAYRE
ncbi:RidA family protein [Sporolactobacillus sp. THM19-2]|uniref:RidA family protein n=1 Tax=Sporolactobacillus sp. THM19-2 TaxID=2511171 RepID=UPI00101F8787|nr:RidA family protein [Sporolactobacillus sp. THM19-2]RYL89281.1 RidA family protein [Sporolactobacillus sp. THM19-2]